MLLRCLGLLALLSLSACAAYRHQFQCSPGVGMPCSSESQIEAQIVETAQGPDIFVSPDPSDSDLGVLSLIGSGIRQRGCPKKIWIAPRTTENGVVQHSYYLEQMSGGVR